MADPFQPDSKSQLLREAQIGLSIVAILLALLVYVAFYKITGRGRHIPEHVYNAPVAELVWPGERDNRVAVREIEMTPQEFRNRMAQSDSNSPATAGPAKRSLTRPKPSHWSMTELKPPLPENPPRPPKISSFTSGTDFQPARTELPVVVTPKLAPATVDPFDTPPRIDPQVEQASLESEVENFEVKSPAEAKTNFKKTIPPTSSPTEATKPSSLNQKPVGFEGSKPLSNDFKPLTFQPDSQQLPQPIDQTQTQDFQGTQPLPISKATTTDQSTSAQPKQPLEEAAAKPESKKLADLFTNPSLDAARPIEAEQDSIVAKRLPKTVRGSTLDDGPSVQEVETEPSLEYVTQPGDSFWSISQSVYDDGRYFRALYKYNEPKVPQFDSIRPGTTIATPTREDLAKLWPDLCPASKTLDVNSEAQASDRQNDRIYVTRQGDTVFDIARQRLGQASRYAEILDLNKVSLEQSKSHLAPLKEGLRIVMPK